MTKDETIVVYEQLVDEGKVSKTLDRAVRIEMRRLGFGEF